MADDNVSENIPYTSNFSTGVSDLSGTNVTPGTLGVSGYYVPSGTFYTGISGWGSGSTFIPHAFSTGSAYVLTDSTSSQSFKYDPTVSVPFLVDDHLDNHRRIRLREKSIRIRLRNRKVCVSK